MTQTRRLYKALKGEDLLSPAVNLIIEVPYRQDKLCRLFDHDVTCVLLFLYSSLRLRVLLSVTAATIQIGGLRSDCCAVAFCVLWFVGSCFLGLGILLKVVTY